MNEFELIERAFRDKLPFRHPLSRVSCGDDASVHCIPPGYEWVVSSDMSLAGRHWPDDFPLRTAACRAVNAALSDLAAMGAEACWLWCCVAAPDAEAIGQIGDGVAAALADSGIELAGGDTVRAQVCSLALTVAGMLPEGSAMRRDTAGSEDDIWLCGALGLSAYALRQWQQGDRSQQVMHDFGEVRPLLAEGQALREAGVRCCIDVSDGLLADAGHVTAASGVGMRIDLGRIPDYPRLALLVGEPEAARLVLGGGEDYALLCTAPQALRNALSGMAVRIGRCMPGDEVIAELDGRRIDVPQHGFDHFAADA